MHVDVVALCPPSFQLSHYLFITLCTSHLCRSLVPSLSSSNISSLYSMLFSNLFFSVRVAPPPLFSLSAVWNAVLSIVLPCNCDTSSSVGLAARSPYLLRLHSVSPPQSAPKAQWTPHPPHPSLATPSSSHPSLSSTGSGKTHRLNLLPLLFLGKHLCSKDMRTQFARHIFHMQKN